MATRASAPTTRRGLLVALAAGSLLATACAPDPDVISISAAPTQAADVADQPADTTDATTPGPTDVPTTEPAETTSPTTSPTTPSAPTTEPRSVTNETALLVDLNIDDVVDTGRNKPARAHDEFVAVAYTDIERWWTEQFPVVYGTEFEPISGGIYAGYPARASVIPGCGEPRTVYDDLQLYVAFYCQFGDFMAYDDGDGPRSLLTPLADEFGAAVMGVVLAHEYGHAIQERIGALDETVPVPTIYTEQQADCFAGAWTGQAYRGESPLLQLSDADVRSGLIAMLSVRDPVGTNQFEEGGHGSAFDRVGAFQEGFLKGPARCAELLDDPLELMPNEFQTDADRFFEGNAPYSCDDLTVPIDGCTDAPIFLADDINDFWITTLGDRFPTLTVQPVDGLGEASCDGLVVLTDEVALCPNEATVVYDEPAVIDLYHQFGDFTLGYFYGIAWAEEVQQVVGSTLTGEDRALLDDCLTGAWVRDITPGVDGLPTRDTTGVSSSPGDLDEAIRMAIIEGDAAAGTNRVGSPFEKIEHFRSGVLGGLDACGLAF